MWTLAKKWLIEDTTSSRDGSIIIFRHIYNMKGKSFTQHERFFLHCVPIRDVRMFDCSVFKVFWSPNYRKFAAQRKWNSKIIQNVQNLEFFSKKTWIWFKIVEGGKLAVESL